MEEFLFLCRLATFPGKTGYDALACLLVMSFSSNDPSMTSSTELVTKSSGDSSQLSNATTSEIMEDKMIDSNAIGRATEVALSFTDLDNEEERKHVYRAVALLANLTRNERGAAGFLLGGAKQLKKLENEIEDESKDDNSSKEVSPSVQLLLGRFLSEKYIREPEKEIEDDLLDVEDEKLDDDDLIVEDEEEISTDDPYVHFASVLTNITQVNAGRNFITSMHIHNYAISEPESENEECNVKIIPPTLKTFLLLLRTSSSARRRRGIASTIKNCCFDTNISKLWILPLHKKKASEDDETEGQQNLIIHTNDDMVTSLLYPLMGPEEITSNFDRTLLDPILVSQGPDKVREKDSKTRLHIIETILLLCASGRQVREILRSKGAYVVLKYADLVEEEEDVGEKIDECVQFLKRDEEGLQEGGSDDLALEMAKERRRIQEDYDGVD